MSMVYDFSFANLWDNAFPAHAWRRLVDDVLERNDPFLSRYDNPQATSSLAVSLSQSLHQMRGVQCSPEQIVFGAGTEGVLTALLELLACEKNVMGMEEPGYPAVRQVATRQRYALAPIPTDGQTQNFLGALQAASPHVVYTTPSRQFPTGRAMPAGLRRQMLEWAHETDAYIIEDDTCWEYRFDRQDVPALQPSDSHGHTIYIGNMSKALSPGMRIAYAVLPPALLERYHTLFRFAHAPVSHLEAEVLARFMDEGFWTPHVQRMQEGMKLRHDTMVTNLLDELGDIARLSGVGSGMHLFASINNGMPNRELLEHARSYNAVVYDASPAWFSKPAPDGKIILGFSSFNVNDIPAAVQALARAWKR